jgi:hypothetical protein
MMVDFADPAIHKTEGIREHLAFRHEKNGASTHESRWATVHFFLSEAVKGRFSML